MMIGGRSHAEAPATVGKLRGAENDFANAGLERSGECREGGVEGVEISVR